MKIILGDNQFFGVNHFDLKKGEETKSKFDSTEKIRSFIEKSLASGVDGFMINSNDKGYEIIANSDFSIKKEIHYSIPYPHKYSNMVNENGMMSLLSHLVSNTSLINNIIKGIELVVTQNLKSITSPAINLEVPRNLRKGSHVYLQNIITDLLIGLGRGDIIIEFIKSVKKIGFSPGLITLNPTMLDTILKSYDEIKDYDDLIVCFNINKQGFNVFPSVEKVEKFIAGNHFYKLMGMSIFSSGASNIPASVEYIKKLDLDYIVFGSSRIENINTNLNLFKV